MTMIKFRISVTEAYISAGRRKATRHCPIFLALKEQSGLNIRAVDNLSFYLASGLEVWLPASARQFILDFDGGAPVEPFCFSFAINSDKLS